jgi:integrase/recombinase XerD
MNITRTPAKKKAKDIAKYFRKEHPNYDYIRSVFAHLRKELEIEVTKKSKKLPDIPTEAEIEKYYETVWKSKNFQDLIIIKLFLYTGIRVSELINIKISDIDFKKCQIRINQGKGNKDRIVPFPVLFKEVLAMHISSANNRNTLYLFESSWGKPYTDRGIRKILEKHAVQAGLSRNISPHRLRHFFLTWLKQKGIDDAFIQPYSGHDTRQSLEVYSKLTIKEAQEKYNDVIGEFPV